MKKALVLFGNESNRENLIKSAIYMRDGMGYHLSGIFISDIRNEAVIPQGFDGMIFDSNRVLMSDEWMDFEKLELQSIEKELKDDKAKIELEYEIGILGETLKDKMKNYDLLIVGKGAFISDTLIEILKNSYKTLMIVGDKMPDFSRIYVANDDGVKVNRSVYNFINIFPELSNYVSVAINNDLDSNKLVEYINSKKKKVEEIKLPGKEEVVSYLSEETLKGVLVMGNISRSYLFEKLTKKAGIKLLEQSKIVIFIG
ncbi:MAG: hypothetical protein ACRCZ2_10275 [Fusobacteriaceae bacterium]